MVPVGGTVFPFVALKVTPTGGTKVVTEGATALELMVMSAVTVEFSSGGIGFGAALTPRTIHGLASRFAAPVPFNASQPALPGPALQPHQLFSISIVSAPS